MKELNVKTKVISLEAIERYEPGSKERLDLLRALIAPGAKALTEGCTVAFPTETVYGIGANALSDEAVAKIFLAKGRPADNPLIVHVTQLDDVAKLTTGISPMAQRLMDAFWPGPLTLILPKSEAVPMGVTAGLETVAVRMPSHEVARMLIDLAGCPVAAPSANISGRPSPTCGKDVVADLEGRVSVILYGDDADIGLESTVVDLTTEEPIVLRPGGVTLEMIRQAVGVGRYDDKLNAKLTASDQPKSPGMKYTHYAPEAEVSIYSGTLEAVRAAISNRVKSALERGIRPGVMTVDELGEDFEGAVVINIGSLALPELAAANLFKALREFDRQGAQEVYALEFGTEGIGMAIMNRLIKAAGHRLIKV